MYPYEDRIRTVKLYTGLGKRLGKTVQTVRINPAVPMCSGFQRNVIGPRQAD